MAATAAPASSMLFAGSRQVSTTPLHRMAASSMFCCISSKPLLTSSSRRGVVVKRIPLYAKPVATDGSVVNDPEDPAPVLTSLPKSAKAAAAAAAVPVAGKRLVLQAADTEGPEHPCNDSRAAKWWVLVEGEPPKRTLVSHKIEETSDSIKFTLTTPGFLSTELSVLVTNGKLIISGQFCSPFRMLPIGYNKRTYQVCYALPEDCSPEGLVGILTPTEDAGGFVPLTKLEVIISKGPGGFPQGKIVSVPISAFV